MKNFEKICRIGKNNHIDSTFIKIQFEAGKLSIVGVEGPKSDGNARGSCGQIYGHPWTFDEYAPGWDEASANQLQEVWSRWHLNDMRPYDDAMARDGWPKQATVKVLGYEFAINNESAKANRDAEAAAMAALKRGETFTPTAEQVEAVNRPYSYIVWVKEGEPEPAAREGYERAKDLYGHNKGGLKYPEHKTLGWLNPKEHPEGLLGRIHPDTGNRYGSKWYRQDVPQDVLEWLLALPDTDIKPAWV